MKLKAEQHYSDEWLVYDDDSYDGPGSVIGSGKTRDGAILGWGKTRHAAILDYLESLSRDPLEAVLEAIHVATH